MIKNIKEQINESIDLKQIILNDTSFFESINDCINAIITCYRKGGKVLIAGNGGSASDAQHIAGEFVGRLNFNRPGLPCISLNSDTSILTSISNDYSYDIVFERQIEAYGDYGDIFIGLTTSGKSKNIIKAIKKCEEVGIEPFILTSKKGASILNSYKTISVPSEYTPRIQEIHMLVGHIICSCVEKELFINDVVIK